MKQVTICLGLIFVLGVCVANADQQTRRIQEELRKRNLYFGDIDGRSTPELQHALRRYQSRKGFEATGAVDQVTANSLHVEYEATPKVTAGSTPLPDVPVLKSDAARDLPEAQQIALAEQGDIEPAPSPAAPAESPNPAQNLTPEQVTHFVEAFLKDAESDDVERQVGYFTTPVEYFDHGRVNSSFVTKDTRNYCIRWPKRHYMLIDNVNFAASDQPDSTIVEFKIAFALQGRQHSASGKTTNVWTVRPDGDGLKITSINEKLDRP